jgi:antitoxin component YwqK of YwqJK toxin-antitoxin module
MKRIIEIFFLFLFISAGTWAQKIPVFGNEKCTPQNDSVSKCEITSDMGSKAAEGIRINGKCQGLWYVYINGSIRQKRYYTKGRLDSVIVYKPNGKKQDLYEYYRYDRKLDTSFIYESEQWDAEGRPCSRLRNGYHITWTQGKKFSEGKYFPRPFIKDSTWVYYISNSEIIRQIENYSSGLKQGDWITFFPDGKTISTKQTFVNDTLEGDDIVNSSDGKLARLIKHIHLKDTRIWIDSMFSDMGTRMEKVIIDSIVYKGDTVYRSSKRLGDFTKFSSLAFPRQVTIGIKKRNKYVYKREVKYWDYSSMKSDVVYDFNSDNTPNTNILEASIKDKNIRSFKIYYQNKRLKENYEMLDNDSIYYQYEQYDMTGMPMLLRVKYNPDKNEKSITYSAGKIIAYSFARPDGTYSIMQYSGNGKTLYERKGKIIPCRTTLFRREGKEDLFTEKRWNNEGKLIYFRDKESPDKLVIQEFYENGKMKSETDSIYKGTDKQITTIIVRKEWDTNGKLFKKEKSNKTIHLDISTFKIAESGQYWDSTFAMISGSAMNLGTKQFLENCNITLTKDKKLLGASTRENGYFEVKKIPAGEYTLIITKDGFSPLEINISIKPSKYYKYVISLQQLEDQEQTSPHRRVSED